MDFEHVYQIEKEIDTRIDKFMQDHITGKAEAVLLENIEAEVYSYPEPMVYKRRHQLDNPANIMSYYNVGDKELTVETLASGTFRHKGVRLDAMVENATGVDWGGNAIYKRPFYAKADEDMQKYLDKIDSYLEQLLNF